jgi:ABC-type transporter Mla maintaining outer membrane lipid asymmetry permease subunit MlaE
MSASRAAGLPFDYYQSGMMKRPIRVLDVLIPVAKALLIAAAIMFLLRFFGLHVREAGGSIAANVCISAVQPS